MIIIAIIILCVRHRQENKHFFPTTNNVPDKGKEHVCTYLHVLNLYWVLDIQLITTRSLPDPLISYILFGDLQVNINGNNTYVGFLFTKQPPVGCPATLQMYFVMYVRYIIHRPLLVNFDPIHTIVAIFMLTRKLITNFYVLHFFLLLFFFLRAMAI